MKTFKQKLELITDYLDDKSQELNQQDLDKIISQEIEKAPGEMDAHLINLCLDALAEYRKSMSE